MRKLSLEKGFLILMVGLLGASCSKEVQEPFETTPAVTTPATPAPAPAPAGSPAPAPAQEPATSAPASSHVASASASTPIGYAAMNGVTKGGVGGQSVTVSTLAALKSAVSSSSAMVITISGTIKGNEGIRVKSNKTIIGLPGATLEGVGLEMFTVNNVIIKNLTFRNLTASDAITIKNNTHHIWVDHCSFTGANYDGFIDITGGSDYVTVSWSKFSGATKNNLVGGGDDSFSDRGKLRVTYHHNYFINNLERSPSVRFGRVHVFNNYYSNTSSATNGYGIASRIEAIVRTDNNYFENFKGNPLRTIDPNPGLFSGSNTNIYKNCNSNRVSTKESNWLPEYSYKSVLQSAESVPASVKAGAGAL